MNSQTKTCQNCHLEFTIEPEDFAFYKKIDVPPPTFCPQCRMQRRFGFRNLLNLYKRTCSLCGESIVSMYDAEAPFPVYCPPCWWGDGWDAMQYGTDYDFSKPFFRQFRELLEEVPRVALINENSARSDYCNHAISCKNCYMCFSIGDSVDSFYSSPQIVNIRNCTSCSMVRDDELCAEIVNCDKSYALRYSRNSIGCMNSWFLLNCRNCRDCVGCVNLRNKQYHIFNIPYTKAGYENKLKELDLGGYAKLCEFGEKFRAFLLRNIHRWAISENSVNVTGDNIIESKNCKEVFVAFHAEHCAYSFVLTNGKDSYDTNHMYPNGELCYETISAIESTAAVGCSMLRTGCSRIWYSDGCVGCADSFGCVSVKKRSYCVLNKQYTKDEYEKLTEKIRAHMAEMPYRDAKGRTYGFGEFFPVETSPFAYNQSVAMEYFPLSQEKAVVEGYGWNIPKERNYTVTLKAEELPDHVNEAGDSIVSETIGCSHGQKCLHNCTTAFRILPEELALYRRISIPLPRTCPNCRYAERMAQRNPPKLWHRKCACDYNVYANTVKHSHHPEGKCPNEFETSYAPDRPEIVYCESCYNSEVA